MRNERFDKRAIERAFEKELVAALIEDVSLRIKSVPRFAGA